MSIATNSGYTISGNTGTNAGTYTAKVVLKDKANTTWADGTTTDLSLSWKINARSISSSEITITVNPSSYAYTGSAITPTYTVKDSLSTINKNLTPNTDYTGASTNNVNVGTATLTITGKGNYTGTKTATFTIERASVTVPSSPVKSYTYTGSAISHGYTAPSGTSVVTSGTTASATNVGTYNIVLAVDSNHKWSNGTTANKTVTWSITAKKLATVTGLGWNGGTASWGSVSLAGKYSVTLYKNGTSSTTVTETSTSYNFASNIQTDATIWTFKVTAVSTNSNYSNSAQSSASESQTTYSITYNANGGSGAPSTQYKINGVNITLSSSTPTRSGYNFKGWGTSSSATNVSYKASATYTSNANLSLYAVWELAEITLTVTNTTSYYYNGGSLYSRSSGSYYECSTCNWIGTSKSSTQEGCSKKSHSRSTTAYYYCSSCNDFFSSKYHVYDTEWIDTSHYETVSETCSNCDGSGTSGTEWESCSDCGGDGMIEEGNGSNECGYCGGAGGRYVDVDCSNCGGSGSVDVEEWVEDGYEDDLSHYAGSTKYYKCSKCNDYSTSSSNGTGCYHSMSSTGYSYKYTIQKGSGSDFASNSSNYETGYYWHTTYGALKKGSTFSYGGYTYEVTNISGTTLTARRKT